MHEHHRLGTQDRALSEPEFPHGPSLLMLLCQETTAVLCSRNFRSFGLFPTFPQMEPSFAPCSSVHFSAGGDSRSNKHLLSASYMPGVGLMLGNAKVSRGQRACSWIVGVRRGTRAADLWGHLHVFPHAAPGAAPTLLRRSRLAVLVTLSSTVIHLFDALCVILKNTVAFGQWCR